jgi:hypothetical protein
MTGAWRGRKVDRLSLTLQANVRRQPASQQREKSMAMDEQTMRGKSDVCHVKHAPAAKLGA